MTLPLVTRNWLRAGTGIAALALIVGALHFWQIPPGYPISGWSIGGMLGFEYPLARIVGPCAPACASFLAWHALRHEQRAAARWWNLLALAGMVYIGWAIVDWYQCCPMA